MCAHAICPSKLINKKCVQQQINALYIKAKLNWHVIDINEQELKKKEKGMHSRSNTNHFLK